VRVEFRCQEGTDKELRSVPLVPLVSIKGNEIHSFGSFGLIIIIVCGHRKRV